MRFSNSPSKRLIGHIVTTVAASVFALVHYTASSANEIWQETPDDFLGKNRILVICGNATLPPDAGQMEFQDRDLVLLDASDDDTLYLIRIYGDQPIRGPILSSSRFDRLVICSEKAEFVLIGKDMGVKKRWENTLPVQDILQTIDAMPMRRYEMRTRRGN